MHKMKLYLYEHCPYCIRVRMILGLKQIECDLVYLKDDDIQTPTKMIGKKVVPILEISDGKYLAESLDLVKYLDNLNTPILKPLSNREDLNSVFEKYYNSLRELVFYYNSKTDFPELSTDSAKKYFVNRFMKKFPYEDISQIKENEDKNRREVESFLKEVSKLIKSDEHISDFEFGYDDIIYFPKLHALSVIPNINWDSNVKKYLEKVMEKTKLKPFIDNYSK